MVLAAIAGCSPSGRSGVTADAASTSDAAGPTECFDPSVMGQVMAGTPDIQVCAIWNSLASMTGNVTLTRDHTNLTMAFGSGVTFTGTVIDRNVMLTYFHLHDFSDGCKWRATETLDGDLDPTSCVMTLSYQYIETVEISNGACATPCTGTSNFSLQINPIIE